VPFGPIFGRIPGAAIDDLDRRRLTDYFVRIRQQDVPEDGDDAGWHRLLVNTEIMVEDCVTLSGMLLFGNVPNRYLSQAGIDAAVFPGKEKDYAAMERTTLRGPMTPLMDSGGKLVESGLVEQALGFLKRNMPITAVLEDGIRRVEKPRYPDEAIRETVINALIHRDYLLTNTDIEMVLYENRLEVISPGRLPNGITPEGMFDGVRAARNQLLKDVMRDYGYLEHMGMGEPREMDKGMKEHNGTIPILEERDERFIVQLLA